MEMVLSMLITLVMGLFSFVMFILAQHRKEIWETIVFPEEKQNK